MVPLPSHKVPRVSWYSGSCCLHSIFTYGAFTLSGWLSQNHSARLAGSLMRSEPRIARNPVWPLPISLAATLGIDVSFSSSGYLDVSVHRVPGLQLWIHYRSHGIFPCRFPHSEIHGSKDICSSPWLFAAYHVFLRLLVPRHPPCALIRLTFVMSTQSSGIPSDLHAPSSLYSVTTLSPSRFRACVGSFRILSCLFLGCLDISISEYFAEIHSKI